MFSYFNLTTHSFAVKTKALRWNLHSSSSLFSEQLACSAAFDLIGHLNHCDTDERC